MGVFHVFKIVQTVQNRATYHIEKEDCLEKNLENVSGFQATKNSRLQ